jgi:hypothetical protein
MRVPDSQGAYAACVAYLTEEYYPGYRAPLTAAVFAYTGALAALIAGASVYFSFS